LSALSTLRFFQAGLAAAILQFTLAVFTTLIVFVAARWGLIHQLPSQIQSDGDSLLASALSILTWIHVLTGVGVALTSNRIVEYTAEQIRRACRVMNPTQPDRVAKILMGQLCFSAAGFVWLAHASAPALLSEICRYFGWSRGGAVMWSIRASVGVASFGANALAARLAVLYACKQGRG
jgi:hypothetical protein